MKKLILIILLFISAVSYSQVPSDRTTIRHGDTLYLMTYSYTSVPDSLYNTVDSVWKYFNRITSTTKDSTLLPTKLKTVGNSDIKGTGDIPITVSTVAWNTVQGAPSFITSTALAPYLPSATAAATYQPIGTYLSSTGNGSLLTGITAAQVGAAATGHNHNGIYEPANSNIQAHVASNANPHGVTKAQVSLSNVDNTSDANKPVSTTTQTALNAKQPTLVSGTNIKTINGSSILGSGNLVVSGGGGSDWVYVKLASAVTTTGTANINTLLAFTPIANTMYEFEAKLFLQSAATTTGVRPGISWPGGDLQNSGWIFSPSSQTAVVQRFFGNTTTANAASTAVAIANEGFYGKAEGVIVMGPSPTGNLTITLASEVSGSEVRIMENSFIRYRIIN